MGSHGEAFQNLPSTIPHFAACIYHYHKVLLVYSRAEKEGIHGMSSDQVLITIMRVIYRYLGQLSHYCNAVWETSFKV